MLDIRFIKRNRKVVEEAIRSKKVDLDLEELLHYEQIVSDYKKQLETLQTERNANANMTARSSADDRHKFIQTGKEISLKINALKPDLRRAEEAFNRLLLLVPNIPAEDAPIGEGEESNVTIKSWGTPPTFSFPSLNHVEILKKNHWSEPERVARIAGSRTYLLKNEMALVEMALIQFAVERACIEGFQLLSLPSLVREEPLCGTGHFPAGKAQVYDLPRDHLYLAGTSEVPINSLHSGEILREEELPLLYTGYSPCFRREAGSAGRDVKGLMRVHQFYKVELFVICKSDARESLFWLHRLLEISEKIVQSLQLPYRVVECCTGEMGAGKVKMFDIETWVPSEAKFRETHSCSSFHDWQARRSRLRYRTSHGDVRYCHTLNNTAIATPRILVPLIENHQNADGTISIPPSLRPFLRGYPPTLPFSKN